MLRSRKIQQVAVLGWRAVALARPPSVAPLADACLPLLPPWPYFHCRRLRRPVHTDAFDFPTLFPRARMRRRIPPVRKPLESESESESEAEEPDLAPDEAGDGDESSSEWKEIMLDVGGDDEEGEIEGENADDEEGETEGENAEDKQVP